MKMDKLESSFKHEVNNEFPDYAEKNKSEI